ncbi:hypothetical protein OA523_03345 [Candidatus Pelagibacter sp.]|nr:hypothetical protein [Candidatus Pelagibacter sp.]
MKNLILNKKMAQLALMQRIELASPFQKKMRKIFGRYLFSNLISKYFISSTQISENYSILIKEEISSLKKFLKQNQNILSIGGGIGGLEIFIMKEIESSNFTFIEKNYISKKIKYGWDDKNLEGYNNLSLMRNLITDNGISNSRYKIIDFDREILPKNNFDLVISLFSLDYHYDFNIYFDYLKNNTNNDSVIIFDTIRYEYFKKIFKEIEIIKENGNTVHKSKRIACKSFKI